MSGWSLPELYPRLFLRPFGKKASLLYDFPMNARASQNISYPDGPQYRPLPPRAAEGIQLFNRGEFFAAHEELEAAWRAETGPVRELYRGILQVAVACYHMERNNLTGARKMLQRSRRWLAPFSGTWQGIEVDHFKEDMERLALVVNKQPAGTEFHPAGPWAPQVVVNPGQQAGKDPAPK